MFQRIAIGVGIVALWIIGACGGGSSSSSSSATSASSSASGGLLCIPGQVEACPCPGGDGMGVQACRADGSGFLACDGCNEASSSSGAGGRGGAGSSSASSGAGGAGGAGSSSTSTSSTSTSSTSTSSGSGGAGGCSSTQLDLYIAFDRSSSMVGNKWDSAKLGLSAFATDPNSAGIEVALNFFPLESMPATCKQSDYQAPLVDFAPLPGNAAPLVSTMTATSPSGLTTPIYPALGGAILAAKDHTQSTAGHATAVVLVIDGAPQGPAPLCGNVNPEDPAVIANLATVGVSFGVKTFVIGLPGVSLGIANQIANAGGTGSAIVVSNVNVQAEFQSALTKVRNTAPCP